MYLSNMKDTIQTSHGIIGGNKHHEQFLFVDYVTNPNTENCQDGVQASRDRKIVT